MKLKLEAEFRFLQASDHGSGKRLNLNFLFRLLSKILAKQIFFFFRGFLFLCLIDITLSGKHKFPSSKQEESRLYEKLHEKKSRERSGTIYLAEAEERRSNLTVADFYLSL